MKIYFRRLIAFFLCFSLLIIGAGCSYNNGNGGSSEGNGGSSEGNGSNGGNGGANTNEGDFKPLTVKDREERSLEYAPIPDNEIKEGELPKAPIGAVEQNGNTVSLSNDVFTLNFSGNGGRYILRIKSGDEEFSSYQPVVVTVYTDSLTEEMKSEYTSVVPTEYGCLAQAKLRRRTGTSFTVEDRYYYPKELAGAAISIRRTVKVESVSEGDIGYSTYYWLNTSEDADGIRYFIPHKLYDSERLEGYHSAFPETELGLPMVTVMTGGGFSLSLARYQPVINADGNYTASLTVSDFIGTSRAPGMRVDYPSIYLPERYFDINLQKQIVYDLVISGSNNADYSEMMVNSFNNGFILQNQRIVDTDIDKVFEVICEDYKTFMLSTDVNGIVSYGLPWLVTIEDGDIGDRSYQSGFVGQQIPAASQMLYYGFKNNDAKSVENGLNILNFWIEAGMMTPVGIPQIWYDGNYNVFKDYPTFLRMGVDTMEGYLDAYVIAKANGVECDAWLDAITAFADFLVKSQNDDGSFYRCFDLNGEPYYEYNGQPEPENSIYKSTSKENTAIPVRFLAELYQLTGDVRYKNAAINAGEYVYLNQYKRGYYVGGTCDNPNVIDKEAGVFAMYCYDAMYTLTRDEKWIMPMKQACAFVMSMVQCFSFPAGLESELKAATGFKAGYNDGCSFITSEANGLDNFAATIYYHLFKLYAITGEEIYFYQAEFMQQNTKSLMDWDGALNYAYGSLMPEATTVCDFGFGSAKDGRGVMGVWLPWQSVANAAPICDMLSSFGSADVADFADVPPEELYKILFGEG